MKTCDLSPLQLVWLVCCNLTFFLLTCVVTNRVMVIFRNLKNVASNNLIF